MRVVVTPEQMGAIDAAAPEPVEVLIGRAGAAVARHAVAMLGGCYGRRVVVVAGKGNNGNDGRDAARRLERRGVRVRVLDAADAPARLPAADLVIDAAYGTGFHGSYEPPDPGGAPVLAVDIPSGVDGLTGAVAGGAVRADRTVTFAALKPGLLFHPGRALAGEVVVADIGLDVSPAGIRSATASASARASAGQGPTDEAVTAAGARAVAGSDRDLDGGGSRGPSDGGVEEAEDGGARDVGDAGGGGDRNAGGAGGGGGRDVREGGGPGDRGAELDDLAELGVVGAADVARWLVPRPADSHKWRTAVVVAAGSPGMTGAAHLAAHAAQRAGAGMVRVATPGLDHDPGLPTEAVGVGVPVAGWDAQVVGELDRAGALVVGPGLGRGAPAATAVHQVVAAASVPVVVDGDGLSALGAQLGDVVAPRRAATVVTPHDGEFARLAGHVPGDDRIAAARELARASGAIVLLKGPTTVVAHPDARVRLSLSGDSRLATAGTGDVLAGIIGSLLAQGVDAFAAAAAGAWLHGEAAMRGPARGLVASDLPAALPAVLADVEAASPEVLARRHAAFPAGWAGPDAAFPAGLAGPHAASPALEVGADGTFAPGLAGPGAASPALRVDPGSASPSREAGPGAASPAGIAGPGAGSPAVVAGPGAAFPAPQAGQGAASPPALAGPVSVFPGGLGGAESAFRAGPAGRGDDRGAG